MRNLSLDENNRLIETCQKTKPLLQLKMVHALTGFDIEKFPVVLLDNTNEFSNSFFSALI